MTALRGAMAGLVALVLVACATARPARAEIVDGVAVIVNGDIITLSELQERAGGQLPDGDDAETAARRQQALKRIAEEAATDKLVERECQDQGIAPTAAEIDNAMEEVQRINNIDRATLEKAITQQGMTMARYREMLEKQLCQMKIIDAKVKSRINISDDDIKVVYTKMTKGSKTVVTLKVRDIFVSDENGEAAAQKLIAAAQKRVAAGEDFEKVARETEGPLADAGGDLGWVKEADLAPQLQPILQLEEGGVSEIIRMQGGFHLMKVEQRKSESEARPLADVREEIRQQLVQERMAKAADEYFAELRRTADIEYRLQ